MSGRTALLLGLALAAAGCRVPPDAGFADVRALARQRLDQRVHWRRGMAAKLDDWLAGAGSSSIATVSPFIVALALRPTEAAA